MIRATPIASLPVVVDSSPPQAGGELRFLIRNIGWAGYLKLLDAFVDRGPRMAYLNGSVEQMTTGTRHERLKKILGRMVEYLIMGLAIPAAALGSTTFNRESVTRGVEPDECYYLGGKERLSDYLASPERPSEDAWVDLEVGPPPDLVIEVELTSPLLDKLAIYAGLGVPELWRYNGRTFTLLLLQADGSYAESPTSRALPFLPMQAFVRHLKDYNPQHETQWAVTYRTWVREVVAPLYQP